MRFGRVEKWGETKMIQCLDVALYQSRESRERSRKAEEVSPQFRTTAPVCVQAHPSSTPSHSTHTYISDNKKKRKETLYFYTLTLLSFSAIHNCSSNSLTTKSQSNTLATMPLGLSLKMFRWLSIFVQYCILYTNHSWVRGYLCAIFGFMRQGVVALTHWLLWNQFLHLVFWTICSPECFRSLSHLVITITKY